MVMRLARCVTLHEGQRETRCETPASSLKEGGATAAAIEGLLGRLSGCHRHSIWRAMGAPAV
jgi:hypothetical protein